jgi:hypothetical protein
MPIQPYYFLITAENDTVLYDIAANRTILEQVHKTPDTTTFYASKADMIEHDAHMEYARRRLKAEEKTRLGYRK